MIRRSSRWISHALIGAIALALAAAPAAVAGGSRSGLRVAARVDSASRSAVVDDSLSGRSGKLWMRIVSATRGDGIAILRRLFGDSAAAHPGLYTASDTVTGKPFSFFNLIPFSDKRGGTIGTYRMGKWPAEKRPVRSPLYVNPDGFIEVTRENEDTRVSEHFRLRDFLTHDQQDVWPKYLVLKDALLDKLELTIAELRRRGLRADYVVVLSGFRTPQYNQKGVGPGGRAQDSRHQYGDAADIFVDNDGDGRMDDLNGDGHSNTRDAKLIAEAADRVEHAHPDLVGGIGIYPATAAHGSFVHIDVRGVRARWGAR